MCSQGPTALSAVRVIRLRLFSAYLNLVNTEGYGELNPLFAAQGGVEARRNREQPDFSVLTLRRGRVNLF